MRIALYARVSTKDQSCELQLRDLRAYCAARGFEPVREYIDVGQSGGKESRPELNRLMEDARKRRFDAIVAWRFDRFARSTKHLLLALEEFLSLGIQFISYNENIDTSSPLAKAKTSEGWLHCQVITVALESTGVYWIPLYEILEQRGIRPCLVNARHMKNVPGRRTDWHECQWLQFLHSVGLLRASFRPQQDVCAVRAVLRHRSELVMAASQHVQHMHKALTQMNLQIHHVIRDITGTTGLAIVDAILAGQRDATELAQLRDPHIKAPTETIRKSLVGNWRSEHLFTLKQSRELYRTYQQLIVNCDLEIEKMLLRFEERADPAETPLPPDRKRNRAGKKRRKKERTSQSRIRSAYRSLQTFWRGCDANPRLRRKRLTTVQ